MNNMMDEALQEITYYWLNNDTYAESQEGRFDWLVQFTKNEVPTFDKSWNFIKGGVIATKCLPYGFTDIEKICSDLNVLLPNTDGVNRILPVIIISYLFRVVYNKYENDDDNGLIERLLASEDERSTMPPIYESACRQKQKLFLPIPWQAKGIKAKNIEDIVSSPNLFRQYLYLATFTKSVLYYANNGICAFRDSILLFDEMTQLYSVYYSSQVFEEYLKLADSDLQEKIDMEFCHFESGEVKNANLYYHAFFMANEMLERFDLQDDEYEAYTSRSNYFRLFSPLEIDCDDDPLDEIIDPPI